jgi:hypothetical protein
MTIASRPRSHAEFTAPFDKGDFAELSLEELVIAETPNAAMLHWRQPGDAAAHSLPTLRAFSLGPSGRPCSVTTNRYANCSPRDSLRPLHARQIRSPGPLSRVRCVSRAGDIFGNRRERIIPSRSTSCSRGRNTQKWCSSQCDRYMPGSASALQANRRCDAATAARLATTAIDPYKPAPITSFCWPAPHLSQPPWVSLGAVQLWTRVSGASIRFGLAAPLAVGKIQ